MIKCDEMTRNYNTNTVRASLIADTKSEVVAMGAECSGVVGLADGTKLELGSDCFTTDCELGILTSNGVWKF